MNVLQRALGSISGGRVLDVATGEGGFIKTLLGNLKSYAEIIGIDTYAYTKASGSVFSAENLCFIQMDAGRIGFGDESFDTVSISSSLHHLANIPQCFGEMKRVLKPGGTFIIRETHRDIQAEPQLTDMYVHHWVAEIDSFTPGYTHNRTFTRQEIVDLVKGLGLRNVVLYDISNTDSDPMDKAAIMENEETIDRYIQYAAGLPGYEALRQRGEELRQRHHEVGVQWEPELIIIGEKQYIPQLTFRRFQGEVDYPLMLSILRESAQADQIIETASLDGIAHWCAPSDRFDPHQDILFALDGSAGGEPAVIGFSRVSWYTGRKGARLYFQTSYLLPDWRDQGFWPVMVRQNERRLRDIAAGHAFTPRRFFQAWAAASQVQWISVLESEGYQAVRHFNNMLRPLDDIPDRALPAGLQVRPVKPEHYRGIWEAQKEVNQELFEMVAENWTEEMYQAWLADPSHTPQLWQVAWDGEQVAGMVLNRIDQAENRARERKRGYTEHVFVRRPWRQRGLASALIAQSLQILKAQGMEEAELGVDSENESGAFGLYKRMGYQTFSTDIWFRKPMHKEHKS
jgi:mycothiol synthase